MRSTNQICHMSAHNFLCSIKDQTVDLIWTDPPYGTGNPQTLHNLTYQDEVSEAETNLQTLAEQAARIMAPTGTVVVCLDWRLEHYATRQMIQAGFTHAGQIVWWTQLGGTSKRWWSNKHHVLNLFHLGDPIFHHGRIPQTRRRGKVVGYETDNKPVNSVWDFTMGQANPERVGYPTQKPLGLVKPFIEVHTNPGGLVVDPFCGSGTTAVAAHQTGRRYMVNDHNSDAVETTKQRINRLLLDNPEGDC